MTLTHSDDWLLDTDPSIRWQVMRDLTDTPAEMVAAERSRVVSEGWGPRPLDQQRPDGHWGDGVTTPLWWSNLYTLLFLRDLGLDPTSPRARVAISLVRSNVTWGPGFGDSPFFEGEVEPCINGRVVALGAYFGERSDHLVDRLLSEQPADGGWSGAGVTGAGCSTCNTAIPFTRNWPASLERRIGGSHCALAECWTGTLGGTSHANLSGMSKFRMHVRLFGHDHSRLLCWRQQP